MVKVPTIAIAAVAVTFNDYADFADADFPIYSTDTTRST